MSMLPSGALPHSSGQRGRQPLAARRQVATRRVATLRQVGSGEAGFTLAELSVTVVILGVVTLTAMLILTAVLNTTRSTQTRLDEINSGRIAIAAITRSLRTAVLPSQLDDPTSLEQSAFIEGTATSVRFYANIDNPGNVTGPSRVTYQVTDGTLTQTIQPPDPHSPDDHNYTYCTPGPGCQVRSGVLAHGVLTDQPVFTYYDPLGDLIPGPVLDAEALASVDAVEVRVSVRAADGAAIAPTTFLQRVALPNHDEIVRQQTNG